jgi:hypothetical protein
VGVAFSWWFDMRSFEQVSMGWGVWTGVLDELMLASRNKVRGHVIFTILGVCLFFMW